MTIPFNIKKRFHLSTSVLLYNHNMTKQQPRKPSSMIFLVLGMVFLAVGLATDQTAFTWIAIAFVLISLISGGRWLRRGK
jgi:hypothetical protein